MGWFSRRGTRLRLGLVSILLATAVLMAVLMLAGCSESPSISAQEPQQIDVEQELQRPGSVNNEPKHMVNELSRMMDEFESQQDSSILIDAWAIAIELAEYDGPMAETFEAVGAVMSGDTEFTPKMDRSGYGLMRKTTPCEDECHDTYRLAREYAFEDLATNLTGCGLGAAAAGAAAGPAALLGFAATFGACGTWAALSGTHGGEQETHWIDA